MKTYLRAAVAALAIGSVTLPAITPAHAVPAPAAAGIGVTVPEFLAGAYVFGFAFCTAFAFGKQTAAAGNAIVGPKARLAAAKDCLLPISGVNKWKQQ